MVEFCRLSLLKLSEPVRADFVKSFFLNKRLVNRLLTHQRTDLTMLKSKYEEAMRNNLDWSKKGECLKQIFEGVGFPSTVVWIRFDKKTQWVVLLTSGAMRRFQKRNSFLTAKEG